MCEKYPFRLYEEEKLPPKIDLLRCLYTLVVRTLHYALEYVILACFFCVSSIPVCLFVCLSNILS